MVLVGQFAQDQAALLGRKVRQHQGNGLVPPAQAAQIGLLARVVPPGQMQVGVVTRLPLLDSIEEVALAPLAAYGAEHQHVRAGDPRGDATR